MAQHLGAYHLGPGHDWTAPAMTWPLRLDSRETGPDHIRPGLKQAVLDCGQCGQGVIVLSPGAGTGGYLTSAQAIASAVLSHIRQCHEPQVIPPAPAAV